MVRSEPVVLVIAGLDPSGGAGLVADTATVRGRGMRAAAVTTALTLQDSARCWDARAVWPTLLARQIELLVTDLPIAAVKVGMLGDARVAAAAAAALRPLVERGTPLVLDPVLRASEGAELLVGEPEQALAPVMALATLVTPNAVEAARLTGMVVADEAAQLAAARALRERSGARAVLVKGGHLEGAEVVDLLDDGSGEPLRLRSARVAGETPHGAGCALSTEIACALAAGEALRAAVTLAHRRTAQRIAGACRVGRGRPFLALDGE
jgi:hydroxymethylpyrimidine/phosphomethylpyrimidine kinase